ncbi:hypothetical protein CQW23_31240 [Capsicum baccatum]|uniref:Protein TAR1 n=1 Tax=Capsicum baccatum TaxID=33114 RepID=A0A2G2V8E7_CAPBA|nr:hypothetical protein CQW23_31240 [Capsicum baccatum]
MQRNECATVTRMEERQENIRMMPLFFAKGDLISYAYLFGMERTSRFNIKRLNRVSSELAVQRAGSISSNPPIANGRGTGIPMPSPQSQSFSPNYRSILLTSLAYIVPSTRGYSPWRPDAIMSTTEHGQHSVLRIFKGSRERTGHHTTCGALPAAGPYLRMSRFQEEAQVPPMHAADRVRGQAVDSSIPLRLPHRGSLVSRRAHWACAPRMGGGSRARFRSTPPSRTPQLLNTLARSFCGAGFDNDPSAGSPTETLLRLLLPLNDKVQWTSRDITGSKPPTSLRSKHFTGSFMW